MPSKVIAVIPAFNEEKTIKLIVKGLKKYTNGVIVVDDGSVDKTAMVAKVNGAVVIRHSKNLGYEKSVDDGFKKAISLGANVVVTFDADGQHVVDDLPKLTKPIMLGQYDLVLGRRKYLNHFAEKIFSLYTKLFYGIDDPLCGMKAYSRKVYEQFGYFDRSKVIGTELALRAKDHGFRIKVVNIRTNNRQDKSRFYAERIKANIKIIKAMGKMIVFKISNA